MEKPEQAHVNGKTHPDLMTVGDLARRTKLSASFWYGAVADGRVPHYRLGSGQGGIRISEEQYQRFLRENEEGGADHASAPRPAPQPPLTLKKLKL